MRHSVGSGWLSSQSGADGHGFRWRPPAVLILPLAALLFESISPAAARGRSDPNRAVNDELMKRVELYAGQTDLALSILTAGDMREIPLTGKEATAVAAARAYWSPARGLLVVADRLPAAPAGRIYQVWVIEKGQPPASAGLLGEESRGRGMLIVTPPKPGVTGSVTVAVSDEHRRGQHPGLSTSPERARCWGACAGTRCATVEGAASRFYGSSVVGLVE